MFKIRSDIPVPDTRMNGIAETLRKLKVGDCFDGPPEKTFRSSVHIQARRLKIKVMGRKDKKSNVIRFWRTA